MPGTILIALPGLFHVTLQLASQVDTYIIPRFTGWNSEAQSLAQGFYSSGPQAGQFQRAFFSTC